MYHNWKYSFRIGTSPLSISTIDPQATELFQVTWLAHQKVIESEITELSQNLERSLRFKTENKLEILSREINDKLADDIAKLRNAAKATLQATKDEPESHECPQSPEPLNPRNPPH